MRPTHALEHRSRWVGARCPLRHAPRLVVHTHWALRATWWPDARSAAWPSTWMCVMHSCLWFSTVTAQSTYLPSTSRRDHAACVPVRAIGRCAPQGTLLSSTGEVSARNAAALQHIRTAGILPIICTGKIPGPWQNAVAALELDAPMVFLQVFQTVVAAGLSSVQTFYTCEHAAASIPTLFCARCREL